MTFEEKREAATKEIHEVLTKYQLQMSITSHATFIPMEPETPEVSPVEPTIEETLEEGVEIVEPEAV